MTLPLLIPAVLLFRSYGRDASHAEARDVAMTFAVLMLLVAALVVLFSHDDPREYTSATAYYGTSDVITYSEAALSFALTALAVNIGWRFSRHVARVATSDANNVTPR